MRRAVNSSRLSVIGACLGTQESIEAGRQPITNH